MAAESSNATSASADTTYSMNGQDSDVEAAAEELGYESAEEYLLALHELHHNGQIHVPPKKERGPDPEMPEPDRYLERAKGTIYHGDSAKRMANELEAESIDLIMTSPPFGLIKEKDYGNEDADAYLNWFDQFAHGFRRVLFMLPLLALYFSSPYSAEAGTDLSDAGRI